MRITLFLFVTLICNTVLGQITNKAFQKFNQLQGELPSPNEYRTASGAPGSKYWQQQADYDMDIVLNDETKTINGTQTITYYNNSPDELTYLWLALDQNRNKINSDFYQTQSANQYTDFEFELLPQLLTPFDGGFSFDYIKDGDNAPISFYINKTMMRLDLAKPLAPNSKMKIKIKWSFPISNVDKIDDERSGYENFDKEDNAIYAIAQFYPRMCVYNDVVGWQNKQFIGRGEFTLCFGNYNVNLTVPADHIVSATGTLQNPDKVLTSEQQNRLKTAETSESPVLIVTQKEAEATSKKHLKETKTWSFKAENVRDFAFASSRKFIWDAIGVKFGERTVLAMAFYPPEANPTWGKVASKAVAHTLKTYSKYSFDYPYPVAQTINISKLGMEYPMICFCEGRPSSGHEDDYSTNFILSVIIHEVGHNYFPMIVNTDERQWMWLDEGLNSFIQYLSEQEYRKNYPSWSGPANTVTSYMRASQNGLTPIMANCETYKQWGYEGYFKPAAALNVLREVVMGHELFDYAFKEYCRRWMFKQPYPADFFRTMEDASAIDLDWFWRGWFFTTDYIDLSIENAKQFKVSNKEADKTKSDELPVETISSDEFNQQVPEIAQNKKINIEDYYFTKVSIKNYGELLSPILLQVTFTDGGTENFTIPVEIWKLNDKTVSKVFATKKQVKRITIDPNDLLADTNKQNNIFPRK